MRRTAGAIDCDVHPEAPPPIGTAAVYRLLLARGLRRPRYR